MREASLHSNHRFGIRVAVLLATAVLIALAALTVSMSERGDAAFPGTNGRIAYSYGDAYQGSIWAANVDGSSATKLTNGSSDYTPSYSPDGSRIAFYREGGIAVMNADGTSVTQLNSGSSSATTGPPKWIKNYEDPNGSSKIIPVVKVETYIRSWHLFTHPSFSPDSTQLAVSDSSGKEVNTSICGVESMGSEECLEYGEPNAYFNYEYDCEGCTSHIITISATSGALIHEVTPVSASVEDYGPAYSADGKIAFTRWSGSGASIYLVNSAGAAPVRLTFGSQDYGADFSPDSSRIVFSHHGNELGIVGVGGGAVSLLSIPKAPGMLGEYVESPVFSPDGTRLAFERYLYFSGPIKSERGVFTIGVDGSGLAKVASDGESPSWQPVPVPPPVPTKAKKKKRGASRLDRHGRAWIGTIVCGSSACSLKVLSASLKTGRKKCAAKVAVPRMLAAGKSAKVQATVKGKCLAGLRKAGKGTLSSRIAVTDAIGRTVLTFKARLLPPKAPKPHRHKK